MGCLSCWFNRDNKDDRIFCFLNLKAFLFNLEMSIISRVLLNVCVISCWEITDPIYWFFEKQKFLYYLFCYVIIIRQPFPSGERVTFTGKEVLCPKCVQIPVMTATPSPPMKPVRSSPTPSSPASNGGANTPSSSTRNYSIRWQTQQRSKFH